MDFNEFMLWAIECGFSVRFYHEDEFCNPLPKLHVVRISYRGRHFQLQDTDLEGLFCRLETHLEKIFLELKMPLRV